MPRQADVLETGDFSGDKLSGLEFAGDKGFLAETWLFWSVLGPKNENYWGSISRHSLLLLRPSARTSAAASSSSMSSWTARSWKSDALRASSFFARIVREVGGVGHDERVGGEELRRGDRARARHIAADHAAQPRLSQSSGPAVMVSVAPASAPVAAKLAR